MGYRALYRKYRPRLFADIVGQPGIVQALAGQVETGRISHAYLFSGPRGTGKTSAAKVLARAINCADNRHGEACGVCRACVELASETNMDVIEIDAASNNSVDKVREMLENVKYMPAVGRFRVYIVDEVHMLSTSAFNALLKTLEEPPAHVVFILATTEPNKLPATVLSRCQQFQFRRITSAAMVGLLKGVLAREGAEADADALSLIARASDGGMRDALSLLDQCLSLGDGGVTRSAVLDMLGTADSGYYFDVAGAVLEGNAGAAIEKLDAFITSGGDIKTFAVDLCRHMRDLFIANYVSDASAILDVTGEEAALLRSQAARAAPGDMLRALGILSELEGGLRYAANPRIPVELALFRCCRVEKAASYEALLARVEKLELALAWAAQAQPLPAAWAAPSAGAESSVEAAPSVKTAPPTDAPLPELPWTEAPAQGEPEDDAYAVEALEGQVSLFGDFEPAAPPVKPVAAPVPPAEKSQPAERAQPPETADAVPADGAADAAGAAHADGAALAADPVKREKQSQQARKLWQGAVALSERKQPNLTGFMKRGKGTGYDGGVLTVTFTQDDRTAVEKLEDGRWKGRLQEMASEVAGHAVEIAFAVSKWTEENLSFIDRSRASIPKGIPMEIDNE